MTDLHNKQISVCQVVASLNEDTGGTATAISSLAGALKKTPLDSQIFTLDYTNCGSQLLPQDVVVHSYPATFLTKNFRGFQPYAGNQLTNLSKNLDLLHNHGLWMFPNLYARQASICNDLPLITSPRGMLETWSRKRSRLKKGLAWWLYEYKNLDCVTAFHATSQSEVASIRQAGFKQPIALISDGVALPGNNEKPERDILFKEFPQLSSPNWLLFLSRLHPKKGLEDLLEVWKLISPKFSDWHLIIAGPDWQNYRNKLEKLTKSYSLDKSVTFTGMLTGDKKISALHNSDLFVLPTYSENFGIAIAESLSYGVPAITTKGAPWQDLEINKCGWWINKTQAELADTLVEAMQLPKEQRYIMGKRGQELIKDKYSWNSIARDMAYFYNWILKGGDKPDYIDHT
ncbi:MAG: glycosyltransferase [Cyanobacteria bacterium P01_F01_bin.150]